MNGAAYRFGIDIKDRRASLAVAKTYIVPIAEYGSIIWRNDTDIQNKRIELPMRFASRVALKRPYDHRDPRYLTYIERMNELNIPTMRERFIISNVMFAVRCAKNEVDAPIAEEIQRRIITRSIQTRSPNLFSNTNLPIGSRLKRIINFANEYRYAIDLQKSTNINKKALLEYILATRVGPA